MDGNLCFVAFIRAHHLSSYFFVARGSFDDETASAASLRLIWPKEQTWLYAQLLPLSIKQQVERDQTKCLISGRISSLSPVPTSLFLIQPPLAGTDEHDTKDDKFPSLKHLDCKTNTKRTRKKPSFLVFSFFG